MHFTKYRAVDDLTFNMLTNGPEFWGLMTVYSNGVEKRMCWEERDSSDVIHFRSTDQQLHNCVSALLVMLCVGVLRPF